MPLPIVALVGRPNVGKSTLFNRIVRGRDSIVHDMPGVTRDRKYRPSEWAGREFILVDTGGYLPESADKIDKAVFEQVLAVIEEATLTVLVVDAKTGLTALDEELAQALKRSGQKIIVAVNKVDNDALELATPEFYRLGVDEQVSLSAISGRKVGDFLDLVVSDFPDEEAGNGDSSGKIALAIIGRPNVGKSSFVNALLGEERQIVTEIPGTTRDAIDSDLTYYGQTFLLIDTAGLRRKSKVQEAIEFYSTIRSMQSIQRCDVAILLVDATAPMESQDVKILYEAVRLRKGIVVAVNKWDLIEKDTMTAKRFEDQIKDVLKNMAYVPIIFISALHRQRLLKAIDVAKSVYVERGKTIKTSELNDFLAEIIQRYPPPSMDRREVKINYCTQIKSSPPVLAFFGNAPKSIRANYRSYIENQLRARFGFFGVPLTLVFRRK